MSNVWSMWLLTLPKTKKGKYWKVDGESSVKSEQIKKHDEELLKWLLGKGEKVLWLWDLSLKG